MEQQAQKARNKGVAISALIRDGSCFSLALHLSVGLVKLMGPDAILEQERYRMHDPHLNSALDEAYQYMTTKIDPVLSKVLELVLLYQPDQTADFLANAVRGTLNLKKYSYVVRSMRRFHPGRLRTSFSLRCACTGAQAAGIL
jgi:hypothetical protein